jgi:FG-GAP-like repeat
MTNLLQHLIRNGILTVLIICFPTLVNSQNLLQSDSFAPTNLQTWTTNFTPPSGVNEVVNDPINSRVVYATTDNGVYKSITAGNNWELINTGLPSGVIYSLAINPNNPQNIFAGTQSNGIFVSYNGGLSWSPTSLAGCSVFSIAINPSNPNIIFAAINFVNAQIFKSQDGGATWTLSNNGIANNAQIGTLAIAPSNPFVIYAGSLSQTGAYKSGDGGATWNAINNGFAQNYQIYKFVVDPRDSARVFAAVNSDFTGWGFIFKSINGGANWSSTSGVGRSLAIDHSNPDILYSGTFNSPPTRLGIYKSTNSGNSWSAFNTGFPNGNGSVRTLSVDKTGKYLHAGTLEGTFPSIGKVYDYNYFIPQPAVLDFDGDSKTDFSVIRESTWYNLLSSSNDTTYQSQVLGNPAFDFLAPGDYDGDGKTDIAIWRSLNGDWLYFNSSNNTFSRIHFGLRGDEPVARDYDGDGKTDLAVVRRTSGYMIWYILQSTAGFRALQFGISIDYPVLGDFDGDGKFDIGVQRGALGQVGRTGQSSIIYLLQSSAGFKAVQWGLTSDYFVSGDYDGDGKTDLAVVRDTNSALDWWILRSSDNSFTVARFGIGTSYDNDNNALNTKDMPVQGDYDGDGKTDIGVWRYSNGTFYVYRSSGQGYIYRNWGLDIDFPTASSNVY